MVGMGALGVLGAGADVRFWGIMADLLSSHNSANDNIHSLGA